MNIAFLVPETSAGGAENQFIDLANSISGSDIHVYLIYFRKGNIHNRINPKKVTIINIKDFNIMLIRYALLSIRLSTVIKRYNITLVYSALFEGNFSSYLAKFQSNIKIITSLRVALNESNSKTLRDKAITFLLKIIYKGSDGVITNSHEGSMFLKKNKVKNYYVVPNFLSNKSINLIKGLSPPDNKKLVLGTLSRLAKQKNPYLIVDVVSSLIDQYDFRNIEIHWVGIESNVYKEDISAYAKTKGVSFKYLGAKENRFDYLAKFDICFLLSSHEGLSNFLLESMYAKKKIIASNVGDNKKILDESLSIVVDSFDEKVISKKLMALINKKVTQEILDRVSSHTEETYSLEQNIKAHLNIFNKIVD